MNTIRYTLMAVLALASLVAFAAGSPELAVGLLMAEGGAVTLEDLSRELKSKAGDFNSAKESLNAQYLELKAKTEGNEKIGLELKEAIDKALGDFNLMKTDLKDIEQRAANMQREPERQKSYGEQFIESDAGKRINGKSRGQVFSAEMKAVTTTTAGGIGGVLQPARRETSIVGLARERAVMRDLIPSVPTAESSIEYAKQTTRTNNAAPVAETTAKPYSDYVWTDASVQTRTLAHLAKISRQAMDDAPRLVGEIDAEMRYGLGYVEERQYLYGDNTGQNLHGIVPQATAFSVAGMGYTPNALATRIDVLRLAILQVALTLFPADGIVLNSIDWALIELTKTTEGAYILANPQGGINPVMWNLPVIATPAMLAGDFLTGAFQAGAMIYDRMGVEVLISTENADDFEKNMATLRGEERTAIAVKRPGVFVTGDFAAALTAGAGMVPA